MRDLAAGTSETTRRVIHRTKGSAHGPIARLMSPSDLGTILKPFVFLDRVEADATFVGSMPMHPHSGIATVTVFNEGNVLFDDPASGKGTIDYGGVEWMRAGAGIWHGKELSPGTSSRVQGYQLWIALSPELESDPFDSHYLESSAIPRIGPARLILGSYEGVKSPVRSPEGINYLLVTLRAGGRWVYRPPQPQDVLWLSVSRGSLLAPEHIDNGELAIFEPGHAAVTLESLGADDCVFVLGSAVAHPHDLKVGRYSVHTSDAALRAAEVRIAQIKQRMQGEIFMSVSPTIVRPVSR
jgi:redox-sensitive bicupin YhaK (pirin superfamily)